MKRLADYTFRHARRIVIFVVGFSVILFGIVAIVVPVIPGFWAIPIGLAILGTEFVWAKRLLKAVKEKAMSLTAGKKSDDPPARSADPERSVVAPRSPVEHQTGAH